MIFCVMMVFYYYRYLELFCIYMYKYRVEMKYRRGKKVNCN